MSQNHHGSALPPSFLPQKFQILSGSALKLIAIFVMLIAHFLSLSCCFQHGILAPDKMPQRLYSSFTVSSSPDSAFLYRAKRLYALPYLPGYRTDCISYFLFSSAGRLFPYPKQKKLRQKSASLCPDL